MNTKLVFFRAVFCGVFLKFSIVDVIERELSLGIRKTSEES